MSLFIPKARDFRSSLWTIRFSRKLKIGVHLLGDDYTNPPPVHELAKRGIVENVVGFDTFYSAQNPPSRIIDAVAAARSVLPSSGAPQPDTLWRVRLFRWKWLLVPSGKTDLPFAFDISMGVRQGDDILKAQLEKVLDRKQVEIQKILKDYGVPLLDGDRKAGAK